MARQPPTQELVAKDLHGIEWRFRHIFRGNELHENCRIAEFRLGIFVLQMYNPFFL